MCIRSLPPRLCSQSWPDGALTLHAQGIEGRLYFNQGELLGFTPARGQNVEGIVGTNSRAQPIARQIAPGTQVGGLAQQLPQIGQVA